MAIMFDIHRFNNIYERWVCCNLCLKIKGFRYDIKAFQYAKRFTYEMDVTGPSLWSFSHFVKIVFGICRPNPSMKFYQNLTQSSSDVLKHIQTIKFLANIYLLCFFGRQKRHQTGTDCHRFRASYADEASEKINNGGWLIRWGTAAWQVKI